MNSLKKYSVLIFLLTGSVLYSQNLRIGVFSGINLNFETLHSTYEIEDISRNSFQLKPRPGFNIGIQTKSKIGNKILFFNNLSFVNASYKDKSEYELTDDSGSPCSPIGSTTIVSNYIGLSSVLSASFFDNFTVGTGLSLNYLVVSRMKFSEKGYLKNTHPKITYYKPLSFSIPLLVTYNLKRFELYLRFDKGLSNRLSESFIKERENRITAGLCYYLNLKL